MQVPLDKPAIRGFSDGDTIDYSRALGGINHDALTGCSVITTHCGSTDASFSTLPAVSMPLDPPTVLRKAHCLGVITAPGATTSSAAASPPPGFSALPVVTTPLGPALPLNMAISTSAVTVPCTVTPPVTVTLLGPDNLHEAATVRGAVTTTCTLTSPVAVTPLGPDNSQGAGPLLRAPTLPGGATLLGVTAPLNADIPPGSTCDANFSLGSAIVFVWAIFLMFFASTTALQADFIPIGQNGCMVAKIETGVLGMKSLGSFILSIDFHLDLPAAKRLKTDTTPP